MSALLCPVEDRGLAIMRLEPLLPRALTYCPNRVFLINFLSLPKTAEMWSRVNSYLVYEGIGISTSTRR